jgi:DTW domain-containing protein YfiP
VNLEQYLKKRKSILDAQATPREHCASCKKPKVTCYCSAIRPFQPHVQFVILINRDEARRSIATGRMAHLCLNNSLLVQGTDFSDDPTVNGLIQDPRNHCVVLYPAATAIDVGKMDEASRARLFLPERQLVVFLIDGTWSQAKRMRRLSRNLHGLTSIRFTPQTLSRFKVRKQPAEHCYSTIEAIHYLLDRLDPKSSERHQNLLEVFERMVEKQLSYQTHYKALRGFRPRAQVSAT